MREKREIIELRFYAFVARPLSRLLAALEVNINKFSQYPFPFSELLSSHPSLSLTRPCGTHVMPRSSHYTPHAPLTTHHSYIVNIVIIITIRPREMQNFENLTIDANLKSTSIVA